MISESRNFPEVTRYYHDKVIVRGRALMRSVLERGIANGEFRCVDIESAIDVIFSFRVFSVLRASLIKSTVPDISESA